MKIINVNYGIASRYNNLIEINSKFKGKLRTKILNHELSHSKGKYTKKDYEIDFKSKDSHFFEVFKIAIINPQMLIGYFPIMYSYYLKRYTLNSSSYYPILYLGLIYSLFWTITLSFFNFNILFVFAYTVFDWIIKVLFLNLILLFYTHIYIKIHN